MSIDFQKIEELKSVRESKSLLSKKENELSKPMLNIRYMKSVYDIFSELTKGTHENRVLKRKKFIFIAMYLFSPVSLVSGRTQNGVRESICTVLEMRSRSAISGNLSDVILQYKVYPKFKNDINDLFSKIIDEMKSRGIIK